MSGNTLDGLSRSRYTELTSVLIDIELMAIIAALHHYHFQIICAVVFPAVPSFSFISEYIL